jgi:hypothetical protein
VEFLAGVEFGELELGSNFFSWKITLYMGWNPNFEVEFWRKLAIKETAGELGKRKGNGDNGG